MTELKKHPFVIEEHYSPSLNSLKRVYTQHPDFSGNELLIYELLFDLWNPNYGYAFPTIWHLVKDSGLSEATVISCIKTLEKLDLIEKRCSPVARNNIYIVKKPVRTIEELTAKFPEVESHMNERIAKNELRAKSSKERFSKFKQAPNDGSSDDLYDW